MKFGVASFIEYEFASAGTIILNIHALRTPNQAVLEEAFSVEPYVRTEEFVSVQGENRLVRLDVREAATVKINYSATVDTSFKTTSYQAHGAINVSELEPEVLPYLYPSRYCQSDKLYRLAWNKFGKIENTYERVRALTDWIYRNVEYLSGSTNSQTSAYDTVTEQAGVCRDFAHLGIALCRALTIPARYFTGYAFKLEPQDFHACFEAYIGGEWVIFDATRLAPLNGLIKIATGRDAADTAVASIYGDVTCTAINVSCHSLDETFEPFNYPMDGYTGLSYL